MGWGVDRVKQGKDGWIGVGNASSATNKPLPSPEPQCGSMWIYNTYVVVTGQSRYTHMHDMEVYPG